MRGLLLVSRSRTRRRRAASRSPCPTSRPTTTAGCSYAAPRTWWARRRPSSSSTSSVRAPLLPLTVNVKHQHLISCRDCFKMPLSWTGLFPVEERVAAPHSVFITVSWQILLTLHVSFPYNSSSCEAPRRARRAGPSRSPPHFSTFSSSSVASPFPTAAPPLLRQARKCLLFSPLVLTSLSSLPPCRNPSCSSCSSSSSPPLPRPPQSRPPSWSS